MRRPLSVLKNEDVCRNHYNNEYIRQHAKASGRRSAPTPRHTHTTLVTSRSRSAQPAVLPHGTLRADPLYSLMPIRRREQARGWVAS